MNSIFKHVSRTFYDIYNSFILAYKTYPPWLFNEMAGAFDLMSELINAIVNDILVPKTRESAYGFASRCDYTPIEGDGSTVTVTATLSGTMNKTINAGYKISGQSSAGILVPFEVTTTTSVTSASSMALPLKQQETISGVNIGTVTGTEDYYELPVKGYDGKYLIRDTMTLLDSNSQTWTRVTNFDASISTDKHFIPIYQSNGKVRIQFGNGTNGAKPALNTSFYLTFAVTLGLGGQLEAGQVTLNTDGDPDISEITNASETSGGNNPESVASIIRNSRANVRLRDIVWTQEDLETTARQASASVQKVLGIPGLGTAVLQVVPAGGGNPSGGLKTTVETYVISKTQFGVMPVTAIDPMYVSQNIVATVTARNGYTLATVEDLTSFALTMATTAIDNQVLEYYDDNGIDLCRQDVINTVWAWAFTSAENDALEFIILQWRNLLGTREYREWGQDGEVGNLWIMGDSLYDYGVDIFSLTSPTTNTTVTSQQILNTGTVAVN